MTETEEECGEPGQSSATGAAVEDSPETGDGNLGGVGYNDTNGSPVPTVHQDSECDATTSLNGSKETVELVQLDKTCKEIKAHQRNKRRKSSAIFAFFPGRRDSMTPLVLTVSRSQRAQTQHQFGRLQPLSVTGGPRNTGEAGPLQPEELDDTESMNYSDRAQLIHPDSEESVLAGNGSIGFKLLVKLKKFKHSAVLSLKDLKYFMR